MFGSTTLIFVLATVVIIVGPGLTLQAIPGFIKFIDPSFVIGYSTHKIDVMTGIVAAVTRINVGFRFPSSGLLLRYNERPPTSSLLSATWFAHGELSFCGSTTAGSLSSSPPVSSAPSVRVHSTGTSGAVLTLRDDFPAVCIYDLKLALMNHPGPQGGSGIDEGKVAAIVVGPMLGTNILSTSLIAWKAWCVLITNSFYYH
jgi:hypothetical protein